MAKAVFTTKAEPAYDDLPEYRYHFPRRYLRQVEKAVGDWILYYEPRRPNVDPNSRGGRQVYFGTARLNSVKPDPELPDHFYAFMGDYLEFENPVPFKDGAFYYESSLMKADGSTNKGTFGWSVRTISDDEYDIILRAGFSEIIDLDVTKETSNVGLAEENLEFKRPVVERLVSRPFRDAAFRQIVKSAYGDTCAFTGLNIINGGGRSEVQAAHIRPVADSGPDSIRNGLALSGTVHWMFDRGLLSVDEDFTILKAEGCVPDSIGRLLNTDGMLRIPVRSEMHPHLRQLEYHREKIFKG